MKKNLLKAAVILPFILSLGCNEPDSSSNTPPNTAPKVHLSPATSLAISTQALLAAQITKFQLNGIDDQGSLALGDTSTVSATLYSDASCATPIQNWSNGDAADSVLENIPITCSSLSLGKSSCTITNGNLEIGLSYYIQAKTASAQSPCSTLMSVGFQLGAANTLIGGNMGASNGYNMILNKDLDGNITSVNAGAATGFTYLFSFYDTATTAATVSVQSSVGSSVTAIVMDGNQGSFNYTVGTLTAATTDTLTITDQYGISMAAVINLHPSMILSGQGLSINGAQLNLPIVTGKSTTISVASGGIGPYTYEFLTPSVIGSTFADGVYTAGVALTGSYPTETIQVTDSTGAVATVNVQVSPHSYTINGNYSNFFINNRTSWTFTAAEDGALLATTGAQWRINGVVMSSSSSSATELDPSSGHIATINNCSITSGNLACALSANAATSNYFYFPVELLDSSGHILFSVVVFYLRQIR